MVLVGILCWISRVVHACKPYVNVAMRIVPHNIRIDPTKHVSTRMTIGDRSRAALEKAVDIIDSHKGLTIETYPKTMRIYVDASKGDHCKGVIGLARNNRCGRTLDLNTKKLPQDVSQWAGDNIAVLEALAIQLAVDKCPRKKVNLVVHTDSNVAMSAV
jgi:hypothetical protein